MSPENSSTLLARVGAFLGGIGQVRLGPGVLGRTGSIAMALLALCAVGIFQLPGLWKLVPLGLAFIAFIVYQIGSLLFATHNPVAALLEGTQFARAHLQDSRAKDMPSIIEGALVSDPLKIAERLADLRPDGQGDA